MFLTPIASISKGKELVSELAFVACSVPLIVKIALSVVPEFLENSNNCLVPSSEITGVNPEKSN